MQLLSRDRSRNLNTLIVIGIVLGVLLVALVAFILVGDVYGFLIGFRHEVFLFTMGALLAYLIAPIIRLFQVGVRHRWLAIALSYLLLFITIFALGAAMINPFVNQARSLINNLHNPATASLHDFERVSLQLKKLHTEIAAEYKRVQAGHQLRPGKIGQTQRTISQLEAKVVALSSSNYPKGQIRMPPSYTEPASSLLTQLSNDYTQATVQPTQVDTTLLKLSVTDANRAAKAAVSGYQKGASTPILLLNVQSWIDAHGIKADLKDRFGKALQDVSNQLASLLNNALGIALQAGNLLLDTVLILIISIYFAADGPRFSRWIIRSLPDAMQGETDYFLNRLDQLLGKYLRTQVVLALLAATLDSTGAVIFGVPYAIVIFVSSFLLSLIPVIGPVILPFPPMLIALIFTSLPTPVIYLVWLLMGEQITTNVIGPRIQGHSVGIHPLEAMAAALVGFHLAGILGSFFAIPLVAFAHVVVRESLSVRRRVRGARSLLPPDAPPPDPIPPSPQYVDTRETTRTS